MVMRNNKGFLRLIEMALAATLILAFILFLQETQSSSLRNPPNYDPAVLKTLGQDVLRSLDLRDNDTNGLSDLRQNLSCSSARWDTTYFFIAERLPPNVGFTLYSVDDMGVSTFKGGIPEGLQPIKTERVAVNYIVAGEEGNYSNIGKPCSIKLVLWFVQ